MHELYIAECILDAARRALPESCAPEDVTHVTVRVGMLDAVVPDTLIYLFNAVKCSRGFAQANLEIEEEDVCCKCKSCSAAFSPKDALFVCPTCLSSSVTVIRGRGLTLMELTLNELEA